MNPAANNASEPVIAVTRTGGSPSYFIRDFRREGAYVECGQHAVHATLRETGASAVLETHDGSKRRSVQSIVDDNAETIGAVEWDFARSGATVYDAAANRMLCGITCPAIEPVPDQDVAAWLLALAGTQARLAALHEWIASTRQDQIKRLATALLIIGPHGVGKSVFATMVARLWGASEPVDIAHVIKQFNSSMTTCPIVADDECKTLARKLVNTEEFRNYITKRERQFEPKGKEMRTLYGTQRFVLSANDVGAFTFANSAGAGAVNAIAERLLQIVVKEADAKRVRGLLDKLRDGVGEIDFRRTSGHLKWIQEATALPDASTRFLGADPDKDTARAAVVASTVEAHEAVFDFVRLKLEGRGEHLDASLGLIVHDGALWARPSAVAAWLAAGNTAERWDSARVRRALGAFYGQRTAFRDNESGDVVKARELDTPFLCQALGINPAGVKLDKPAAKPAAKPAKKLHPLRGKPFGLQAKKAAV